MHIKIKPCNDALGLRVLFHSGALWVAVLLDIPMSIKLLLIGIIAAEIFFCLRSAWRADGVRCLIFDAQGGTSADIGGTIHQAQNLTPVFLLPFCIACALHLANGTQLRVLVHPFGLRRKAHFRMLWRRLQTGQSW